MYISRVLHIYSNPNLFYLLPKFDLILFSSQGPINLALIPNMTAPDPGSRSDVNTKPKVNKYIN